MKRLLFPVIATTSLISCHNDDQGQSQKDELKNIVIEYYNSLWKQDLQKANSLTTANFILFDEGLIFNNKIAIDSVSLMKPFSFTTSIDSMNVLVVKNDASAYYFRKADFHFTESNTSFSVKFLESATFHREDGKWKLRFLHSSIRK